ncbi:MAG TPA: NHLP leader peptide family RiPP precursor [Candidatus Methylomirabilis sp.]|jgi:Nitrile hydratase, alpha chain
MSTEGSHNKMGEIVSKCWKDAEFKKRFVSDPNSVLREHQIEVPAGVQLKVVENTDKVVHFTLPAAPTAAELSDAQLEKAAGGGIAAGRAGLASQDTVAKLGMVTPHLHSNLTPTMQHANTCGRDCIPW